MCPPDRPCRLRLHEQIKHTLFAQIRPELLHTDREFEQLKEVLFAHVDAALTNLKAQNQASSMYILCKILLTYFEAPSIVKGPVRQ